MTDRLGELRQFAEGLLEMEAAAKLDPLVSTHIISNGFTHMANLTEEINDPKSTPHYRGRCIAMTYKEWSDLLAVSRNALRPLAEMVLGLLAQVEDCPHDPGQVRCLVCIPARKWLAQLAAKVLPALPEKGAKEEI